MLFIGAVIAVHVIVLSAVAAGAWILWRRLPGQLRSLDIALTMLASVALLAVMIALPHWGFGQP
jgi:hypothetical protein